MNPRLFNDEQESVILKEFKKDILDHFDKDGLFDVEYTNTKMLLVKGDPLTIPKLLGCFYLIDTTTGRKVGKKQQEFLLRAVDLKLLAQQRDRLIYLVSTHPNLFKPKEEQVIYEQTALFEVQGWGKRTKFQTFFEGVGFALGVFLFTMMIGWSLRSFFEWALP